MQQEELYQDHQALFNYKTDKTEEILSEAKGIVLIREHFRDIYPEAKAICRQLGYQIYQFEVFFEIHEICRTIVIIKIDFQNCQLGMHVQFAEQYERMKIQSQSLRLQLDKYMMRLNNLLPLGNFYVNMQYGYVGLNLFSFDFPLAMTKGRYGKLFHRMDSMIYTGLYLMKIYFKRIWLLINPKKIQNLLLDEENPLDQIKKLQFQKLPREQEELLDRIKLIVKKHLNFPFTKQQYNTFGNVLRQSVIYNKKCLVEIQITGRMSYMQIYEGRFYDIHLETLYYTIGEPQRDSDNAEMISSFMLESELILWNNEETICSIDPDYLNYGAFGPQIQFDRDEEINVSISSDDTFFNPAPPPNSLVIKKEKNSKRERVEREKQILLILSAENNQINSESDKYIDKNGCCPYIAQYYYDNHEKGILIMENYCNSSLNNLNKEGIELSTRIYIAHCIAMGLRYCHSYGIVHMDIKPANILLDSQLMAKLAGFDEAMYENKKVNSLPEKTPYVDPEIKLGCLISKAYDIFSFGVLLFELIFDRYPLDVRHAYNKQIEKIFLNNDSYMAQYVQTRGSFEILKCLGKICLRCLHSEPEKRPNIDKICIVLQDCLAYFDGAEIQ